MSIANHKQNTATTEGCAAADLPAAPSQQDAMQAVFASITAEMTAMERIETKAAENRHWSLADAMKNKRLAYDAALGFAMRGIEQAYSSAQWVKEYGKANLGVGRAAGHCRNCRHRFRSEDSYFPDEGDYCAAVGVDEIQFCPAWREHCDAEVWDGDPKAPPRSKLSRRSQHRLVERCAAEKQKNKHRR